MKCDNEDIQLHEFTLIYEKQAGDCLMEGRNVKLSMCVHLV